MITVQLVVFVVDIVVDVLGMRGFDRMVVFPRFDDAA
jgi:hypothetical protein